MNTLNKTITSTFYTEFNSFELLEQTWKTQVKEGFKPTSTDLLYYAVLRGKDYRKAFTPITRKIELENGAVANGALRQAITNLSRGRIAPFLPNDKELLERIINILPATSWNMPYPEQAYRNV